jgi:hypothetical protein
MWTSEQFRKSLFFRLIRGPLGNLGSAKGEAMRTIHFTFATIFVSTLMFAAFTAEAAAQMPIWKMCQAGMNFQTCFDRCIMIGGTSGEAKTPQQNCGRLCYRLRCR